MAEKDTAGYRIEDNSPEHVAYKLVADIVRLEKPDFTSDNPRKWLLDTYAECIEAVTGKRKVK